MKRRDRIMCGFRSFTSHPSSSVDEWKQEMDSLRQMDATVAFGFTADIFFLSGSLLK